MDIHENPRITRIVGTHEGMGQALVPYVPIAIPKPHMSVSVTCSMWSVGAT